MPTKALTQLRPPLPKSLIKAAGLLRGKRRVDPLRYQRAIRKEWETRLKTILRQLRP